jgi:Multimeric flavodoxin WrbA
MKKVLVISTSLRGDSNSDLLADEFIQGAEAAGNETEKISLTDKNIAFCRGCLACQELGRCVIDDDAIWIAEKMEEADVIVYATPIYYYEMSGQMKTLIDRCNSLFPKDYRFRDIYLLTASAVNDESAADGARNGLEGWIACFPKAHLAGKVHAGGVEAPGEAAGHPALKKVFEMGKNV